MKFRTVFSIVIAVIFAFSLMTAQTKDKAIKKTSDKKSECPMHSMKAGAKDTQKCAENSKDYCKKDGKMSENCSKGDKAKCDMSKCDKSKCDKSKCDTSKCDMSKCDKSKCDKSKCTDMKSSETKTENGKK